MAESLAGSARTHPVLMPRPPSVELCEERFVEWRDHRPIAVWPASTLPSPVVAETRFRFTLAAQPELADAPVLDSVLAWLVEVLDLELVGDAVPGGGADRPAEVVACSVLDGDLVLHAVVSVWAVVGAFLLCTLLNYAAN